MSQRYDAIVVGAGPAGCASAIHLARAGRRVAMIDKARFPRDKFCGDGLTAAALRELEALGVAPEQVPSWRTIDACAVRSPQGREVSFPLPRNGLFAVVAKRIDLDAALVSGARHAGVDVFEGHALGGVARRGAMMSISVEGLDPLDAPIAIGADGMWSPLRKALGVAQPGYRGEWHAFRQYFTGVSGRAARELIVWFERDLLPGYAWSFPLANGGANVGFGIQRGRQHRVHDMARLWPELLGRAHIREAIGTGAVPESPHRAWPIPARVDRVPLSAPGALFVGDAAAATDPMTGEGIGQALLTGRLAARAIVAGGDIEASYASSVQRHLFADHRLSVQLSKVLARSRGAELAVRVAGTSGWTRRHFARWLFEDYPRAVLLTPRRWRRDLFTRPGAYA